MRDTVAEMAAKAHEISLEAGSKMAGAMKDVINAAAGLAGFAVESARDLVQYMVRRGQMTQDEADKLLREAEEAYNKRKPRPADTGAVESNGASKSREAARPAAAAAPSSHAPSSHAPSSHHAPSAPGIRKAGEPTRTPALSSPATAAKSSAAAPARAAAKGAAKQPAKAATKAAATKGGAKAAVKSGAKAASKSAAKKAPAKKK
ncbi:MAG TPA: hypothetical protein VFJ74_11920 [Gemmatimonadaceae bacterium]|nr:hypothetical protein [Gemmatimonadaceae bacterium]